MKKIKLSPKIFEVIYPVGSIYKTTDNVNPSKLFGGTWELIYNDYDKILVASQSIYPAKSGSSVVSKTMIRQNYSYELVNRIFQLTTIPPGYSKKYRLSVMGKTETSGSIIFTINKKEILRISTWSWDAYRHTYVSELFTNADLGTLETVNSKQGLNLYYQVTESGAWAFEDLILHGYFVSDDIIYKWKRIG